MARHLITSAIFLTLAYLPMVWVCTKFPIRSKALRNFGIGAVAVFGSVVLASMLANVTVRPCRRDATQVCEYNDMVPFIATVVAGYTIVTIVKSWWLYIER